MRKIVLYPWIFPVLFPIILPMFACFVAIVILGTTNNQPPPFQHIEVNGVQCDVGWQEKDGKGHYVAICPDNSMTYL